MKGVGSSVRPGGTIRDSLDGIGTMDVPGTEHARFKITEPVEHEKQMIAGAFEMAIVGSTLLIATGRADAAVISSTTILVRRAERPTSIHRPDKSVRADRFSFWLKTSVSNRAIWLVEAAWFATARPPTIQRIAGSFSGQSASLPSSYPATRPNSDSRK